MEQKVSKIKIKSIKYKDSQDVYNMEVQNTHCFAVNGGYIVHNCLRYGTEPYWEGGYFGKIADYGGFDMANYLGL